MLDLDDIDAAFAELDARYLAGEGAEHSHTWSLHCRPAPRSTGAMMPPTTPDWVNIDHRKLTAFAPGDMTPYMRATFDVAPDIKFYIEAVHRLTTLGAVFTQRGHGTSQEGFEGEWRDINLMTIEGDQIPLRSVRRGKTSTPRSPDSTSSTGRRHSWRTPRPWRGRAQRMHSTAVI